MFSTLAVNECFIKDNFWSLCLCFPLSDPLHVQGLDSDAICSHPTPGKSRKSSVCLGMGVRAETHSHPTALGICDGNQGSDYFLGQS